MSVSGKGISGVGVWVAVAMMALPITAKAQLYLPDNGNGSADMPPAPHVYYNELPGKFVISAGLPPVTTIENDATLGSYSSIVRTPGGTLGNEIQTWNGVLFFNMVGTGSLLGFNRTASIPVQAEVHDSPHTPFDPSQSFTTELYRLQGQITGDPDFDLLRITAGSGFGMPSPGQTDLWQAGPQWEVDSFFDVTYRIDFVGAPGGPLGGMSGSTTSTVRIILPEPGSALLLGLAMCGLLVNRRRVA